MSDEQAVRGLLLQRMRAQGLKLTTVARHLEVSPLVIEAFLNGAKLTGAMMEALPEILVDRNHEAQLARNRQTLEKQVETNKLSARNLKCTIVLDAGELAAFADPNTTRVSLRINVADGGRVVVADIAAKSLRKAKATIAQSGTGGAAVILQGKLVGDVLTEAGLVAQERVAKS